MQNINSGQKFSKTIKYYDPLQSKSWFDRYLICFQTLLETYRNMSIVLTSIHKDILQGNMNE